MTGLIERIHQSSGRFSLAISGGGSQAISELLAVPGASATVLEASVPYHEAALTRYLGQVPDSAASAVTARNLAMVSWLRAKNIANDHDDIFGLGVVCALSTNRDRRGENRCFISIQSAYQTNEISVVLNKGDRQRHEEERLVADLILHYVAESCGVESTPPTLPETLEERQHQASDSWSALLVGNIKATHVAHEPLTVFPGAFNPLHQGHSKMISYAENLLGRKVNLEISIRNVDKPPIDFLEMQSRQEQLDAHPVIFSNAPTFAEKARTFPRCCFIVGTDTLLRIADKKYYGNSEEQMVSAINELHELECRMLVFGRLVAGQFQELDDLALPKRLKELCTGVVEEDFRQDISSTKLREGPKAFLPD